MQAVPVLGSEKHPIELDVEGLEVVGQRKPTGVQFVTMLSAGDYQKALRQIFAQTWKSKGNRADARGSSRLSKKRRPKGR